MAERKKIYTVLGPIDPDKIGATLTHEHLSMVFDVAFVPASESETDMMTLPITMENLGWIRQNPYSHKNNLVFNDQQTKAAVEKDLLEFKKYGGGTIVENTTHGLQRNLNILKEMSAMAGINIVAGTGYYVAASQDSSNLNKSVEDMANVIRNDLLNGEDGIKCGLIGELGCSWPLHDFEKRNLTAAAAVQQELGAPVMIHPGRDHNAPAGTLRYFLEAGGKVHKTVMAHLDRTLFEVEELLEFASLGSLCEFDLFGIEVSHYQLNENVDMISDAERIKKLGILVKEGYEDKIVVSHDIHSKHRLKHYGGHGYAHIMHNIIPKMKKRGFEDKTIDKILTENPKTWLSY